MEKLPDDRVTTELVWNWDGKLRSGTKGTDTIELRYDPLGNRVSKTVNESGGSILLIFQANCP